MAKTSFSGGPKGYANKKKSGSKRPRNYDPKNTNAGGGGRKPRVASMYKPKGNDTPSAPGK